MAGWRGERLVCPRFCVDVGAPVSRCLLSGPLPLPGAALGAVRTWVLPSESVARIPRSVCSLASHHDPLRPSS